MAKEMEHVFVKPIPGGRVRDPITLKPLDENGERKPLTTFWLRRLRMGDVVKVDSRVNDTSTVAKTVVPEATEYVEPPKAETPKPKKSKKTTKKDED